MVSGIFQALAYSGDKDMSVSRRTDMVTMPTEVTLLWPCCTVRIVCFFLYTSVKLPECLLSYRMDMLAISEAGFISGLVRKRENHGCFVKMPSRRKSNDEK
jgi:hypothetical protein